MEAETTFHSPTSSDSAILKAFENVATALKQDSNGCLVHVVVMDGFSPAQGGIPLSDIQRYEFVQFAEAQNSASWSVVLIEFDPLPLTIRVGRERERGDDRIEVKFTRTPPDPIDISRALSAIQEQFVPFNRAEAIERALGSELAEFYRLREEGLSRLENLTQKLITETHSYRMQLDAEIAQHKQELTESHEARDQALDAKFQERNAELDSREQELNRLRQDLDDRSARHARREQSRALQKKISDRSENFTLTRATGRKRLPVHIIFTILLSLSGGLIGSSLATPVTATEGAALWLGLGRLPLGALGFALTALFYIRWTDQWFRQHANQEFKLQQLALDVDRAGYVTEMLMEWQEEKGGEMPTILVDRLTAGLFTEHSAVARVRHPSEDATAALLRAASSVQVEVPSIGKVTLPGSRIGKLKKGLAEKQDS